MKYMYTPGGPQLEHDSFESRKKMTTETQNYNALVFVDTQRVNKFKENW